MTSSNQAAERIVMVGTHPDTMGGISTVVRGYKAAGLFDRFPVTYVVTHRDGSAAIKARSAIRAWFAVARELLRGNAPLFHIHLSSRASFWRKLVICFEARLARRPYILHVHGSEFMRFYREECGRAGRALVRWAFRRAAVVIALSEQWRDDLLEICPSARVVVLPNAVGLPDLRLRRAPVVFKPPATHKGDLNGHMHPRYAGMEPTTIAFLGRLGERKGVFDLLRAFASAAQDHPHARLVCAGDGEVSRAAALAEELGIADRVTFPGWLNAEGTRELLSRSEIFVLPSRAEGLPMALLEAMSWRLAVLVTAVGGIPQVVRHDLNGIFVTPGDVAELSGALKELLSEPQRRARLAAAARATIEQSFSLDQAVERLTHLYRDFGVPQRMARGKNP
jgi:glycosyltransferase involved in cell wall biosynthesis